MTYPLDSLIEDSFYLTYYTGIQPSELDKLTTYEIRKYTSQLNLVLDSDSKKESSLIGAMSRLFVPRSTKSIASPRRR